MLVAEFIRGFPNSSFFTICAVTSLHALQTARDVYSGQVQFPVVHPNTGLDVAETEGPANPLKTAAAMPMSG